MKSTARWFEPERRSASLSTIILAAALAMRALFCASRALDRHVDDIGGAAARDRQPIPQLVERSGFLIGGGGRAAVKFRIGGQSLALDRAR